MFELKYKIKLNDENKPYIELDGKGAENPEHKFACFELSRYILHGILQNNEKREKKLDDQILNNLMITFDTISKISDEMSELLKNQMEKLGEVSLEFNRDYDLIVSNYDNLLALKSENLINNTGDKTFRRTEGLKVLVFEEMMVYELIGGVSNDHWDGKSYYKK